MTTEWSAPGAKEKLDRARHHFNDLSQKFASDAGKSDDAELCRSLALVLGDGIHNARSALDVCVWEIALAHHGRRPAKPNRVSFPVSLTKQAWNDSRRNLAEVLPEEVITRIEHWQPVLQKPSERVNAHPLAWFHQLDIADKHQLPLSMGPDIAGAGWEMVEGKMRPAIRRVLKVEIRADLRVNVGPIIGSILAVTENAIRHLETGVLIDGKILGEKRSPNVAI